jgi:hypothetical protein
MLAIASAALAVPLAGFAQSYDQGYPQYPNSQSPYGQPGYGPPGYDQPRGDFRHERHGHSGVYPQFRAIERHIQHEIEAGVRDDMLAPDDAHDLMSDLRAIQYEEMREYRVHGWTLPYDDQARIQAGLSRLDHRVDETRDEP